MKEKLRIMKKLIKYCFDTGFFLTSLLIMASITAGLFSTIRVWVLGQIVNQLSFDFSFLSNILPYIFMLLITLLLWEASVSFMYYFRRLLMTKIKVKMKKDLITSINNISPLIQEINDTQMKIGRGLQFIDYHAETSLTSIVLLTSDIVSVISVTILLIKYSWVFPVLALFSAIPIIFIRIKQDAAMHEMYKNQYPDVQLANYYLNSLTDRKSILELMLFNAQSLFTDKFIKINRKNMRERTNYFIEHTYKGNLLESIVLMAGNFLSLIWAIYLLYTSPVFTIGALSMVINGIMNAQNNLIAFAFNGKYIYQAILYGEDFWELCEKYLDNNPDYKYFDKVYSIELRDVFFKYPNNNDYTLKNINLKLNINESLGVTGVNGSGKSTLCKVILGVYKPTEGEVFINGENVTGKNYIFADSGVVFQDFIRYELTPGENIYFGSIKKGYNELEIIKAAKKSGAHEFIDKLPDKYYTPVGTLFKNSTYLSGGQWQRLAIARGLYAKGNFVVLDEPNASMDPRMEAILFREFQEVINKKECIGFLISHRLGSTKDCDRIIVMEDEEIIEEGNYEELMTLRGRYSQMYSAQSRLYTEESV